MKKAIILLLMLLCICGTGFGVSKNAMALLNRSIKVQYEGQLQKFQDANGMRVYPLTYEGTTYLPIRAISSMFHFKIQWDGLTNSVYIGAGELDTTSSLAVNGYLEGLNEDIVVLLNEDVKIYYQGQMQTFRNVNGEIVYPLSYEGTTYLPVRAISNLFGTEIGWDASNNTVSIGIKKTETKVSGVSMNKTALNIEEGETNELVATVTPNNAINKKVLWTSSNTKVATVKEGRVTGIKAGTATITVTTIDGGKQATCKVTVTTKSEPEITKVESIKLNKESTTIVEGGSETLTVAITPSNATNKNVTWSSSNTNVATISNGIVKGVKAGTAVITVQTVDGNKRGNCIVTVKAPEETKISVTGVTLNKTSMSMKLGETVTLTATITPTNATNKNVTWSSSNTNVATVSNGTIKGIKAGTAIITVQTVDGNQKGSCMVTVKTPEVTKISVTGVTLNKTSVSMKPGETVTLTATITPSNATNKNVTWSSSNTNVATVSNGTIKGIKAGTAIIAVQTADGNQKENCIVTVKTPEVTKISVKGVTLNKMNTSLEVGKSEILTATITPSNATNKNVTWSSSNTNVATVSNGTIKGIKAGMAIITVKTVDGNQKGNCIVAVKTPEEKKISVTGVSLNKTTMSMKTGETATLTASITPTNATNKNVTWSSSNTNIATVSNGKITAIKPGTVTINVKTVDGGKEASCKVTIVKNVKYIAHRGASDRAPENTVLAFQKAVDLKAYGIETDIQVTKDGYLVCCHNSTVNSTTNGKGTISKMTLSQIRGLKIKKDTSLKIPTFEEYLEVCKKGNCIAQVELKTTNKTAIKKVLKTINEYGMKEKCIIISFNNASINYVRELDSTINIGLILSNSSKLKKYIDEAAKLKKCIVCPSKSILTQKWIDYAHSKNVDIDVWTIDTKSEKEKWTSMGVDYITTNQLN